MIPTAYPTMVIGLCMQIGAITLPNNIVLAPMAGVTDLPFRQLCKRLGAGLAVSEMVAANPKLWGTDKSQRRTDHTGETEPKSIQIAGGDPQMLAEAARYNESRGAQIIDINMGCPAKKVCNKAAGSALLKDESLVERILHETVAAVSVPVTLKIRTGWDHEHQNGVRIAQIAEQAGIKALAVHGRTRACKFEGSAEYDVIREIKSAVSIPVIANGDINSPQKAKAVLDYTGADGVMIGRAAQGRPWLFREIAHYLATGEELAPPPITEIAALLLEHLDNVYAFYGDYTGVRIARKHIGWYLHNQPGSEQFRAKVNAIETCREQWQAVHAHFISLDQQPILVAA